MKTILELLEECPLDLQQIKSLEKIDIAELNAMGENALIVAFRMGHYAAAQYLLSVVPDITTQYKALSTISVEGYTALFWACAFDNTDMVQLLLDYEACIHDVRYEYAGLVSVNPLTGENALILAARLNATQAMKTLLSFLSRKCSYSDRVKLLAHRCHKQYNALIWACEYQQMEMIGPLVSRMGPTSIFSSDCILGKLDQSPIMYTVKHKKLQAFQFLLNYAQGEAKKHALELLHMALLNGDQASVELLLPLVNKTATLLARAVFVSNVSIVRMLIQNGCKPEPSVLYTEDYYYGPDNPFAATYVTPLMWAARKGDSEMISVLLECNAEVDLQTYYDKTALMYSVLEGHMGAVNSLLCQGKANPNLADDAGNTPLMQVYENGEMIIPLLLRSGADPYQCNLKGDNALTYYVKLNRLEQVKILLENGVDPNRESRQREKPLILASEKNDLKMIQAIGDTPGCDFSIKNKAGKTILFMALESHRFDIAIYLIERGKRDINEAVEENKKELLLHYFCKIDDVAVILFLVEQGADVECKDKKGKAPVEYAIIKKILQTAAYEKDLKALLPVTVEPILVSKKILQLFVSACAGLQQVSSSSLQTQDAFFRTKKKSSLIGLLDLLSVRCQDSDKLEKNEFYALKLILEDYGRGLGIEQNPLSDAVRNVILSLAPFSFSKDTLPMNVDELFNLAQKLPLDADTKKYMFETFLPGVRTLIEKEDEIIAHMMLPTSELYILSPDFPIHTIEPKTTDRKAIQAHLHSILHSILGAAKICHDKGILPDFLSRISEQKQFTCIEGRIREPLEWVAIEGNATFDDLMTQYLQEEYHPYVGLMQNANQDARWHVGPAKEFILKRHRNTPCERDPNYAPNGVVSDAGVERYLQDALCHDEGKSMEGLAMLPKRYIWF